MDIRKSWLPNSIFSLVLLFLNCDFSYSQSLGSPNDALITVQQLIDAEMKADRSKQLIKKTHKQVLKSPSLLGIWGVQQALVAHIHDNGQVVEFISGHSKALVPHQHYSLIAIKPPCVEFFVKKKRLKVCF